MFQFSLGFKPLYNNDWVWFPLEIPWASLVSQSLTGNDVRVGGPSKSGWGLGKVGGAYKKQICLEESGRGLGKVGVVYEK